MNTSRFSSPIPLFVSLRSISPLLSPSLCFLLAAHLSSSAFLTVQLIVVVFSSCNTQITVTTLFLPSIPYSMICGTIAQGRTIETPSSLCTITPLGFWWPIKCNNEHREDPMDVGPNSEVCDHISSEVITSISGTLHQHPSSTTGAHPLDLLFPV